jgi:hypothetical protein
MVDDFSNFFIAKFIACKLKYSPELCKCMCLCSFLDVFCPKKGVYRCRNSEVDMLIYANVIVVT